MMIMLFFIRSSCSYQNISKTKHVSYVLTCSNQLFLFRYVHDQVFLSMWNLECRIEWWLCYFFRVAPRPRFDYDQSSLSNAIDAVRSKRLTLSEAVIEFRIPKNTLIGWMNRVGKNKMAVSDLKNNKKINIFQNRPTLTYNSQDLDKALESVLHHGKTVTEAAALFRVNRRTLNDRVLKAKRGGSLGVLPISGDGTKQQVSRYGVESDKQMTSCVTGESIYHGQTAQVFPSEQSVPKQHNASIGLLCMQNASSIIHRENNGSTVNTSDVKISARHQENQDITTLNAHSVLCNSAPRKKAEKKGNNAIM